MNHLETAKQEVLNGCQATIEKAFTVGTAGNISARVEGEDLFVITPTTMDYAILTAEDLVVIDMEGKVVEGKYAPSIEHNLHRLIYLKRPDVKAVVHVHSTYATAYASIEGLTVMPSIDIESINYLGGDVDRCPFAAPGSDELAVYTSDYLGKKAAVLMQNHGSTCVGKDMSTAITACEIVEKTCYSLFLINTMGKPIPFDDEFKAKAWNKYSNKFGVK